jgi:hypothetical protein
VASVIYTLWVVVGPCCLRSPSGPPSWSSGSDAHGQQRGTATVVRPVASSTVPRRLIPREPGRRCGVATPLRAGRCQSQLSPSATVPDPSGHSARSPQVGWPDGPRRPPAGLESGLGYALAVSESRTSGPLMADATLRQRRRQLDRLDSDLVSVRIGLQPIPIGGHHSGAPDLPTHATEVGTRSRRSVSRLTPWRPRSCAPQGPTKLRRRQSGQHCQRQGGF